SFFVAHRHAGECLTDIPCRSDWIRLPVRSFGIHVDQSHLHGSQRIREVTLAAVTLVGQPLAFGTPENVFRCFPNVGATAAKTEVLKTDRFQRDVARENHETSPVIFLPIFLLFRQEHAAAICGVHVAGPVMEGSETLCAGPGAATAITDTVRACAVPCHTD